MVPPSLPHSPDPMLLMLGIIKSTVIIASLIREEEQQGQAAMSVTIVGVMLEQHCQQHGEYDDASARK
jgi:hypothetical protein